MSQTTAPKCIPLFILQPAELIIRDRPGSTSIKSSGCVRVWRGCEVKWDGVGGGGGEGGRLFLKTLS